MQDCDKESQSEILCHSSLGLLCCESYDLVTNYECLFKLHVPTVDAFKITVIVADHSRGGVFPRFSDSGVKELSVTNIHWVLQCSDTVCSSFSSPISFTFAARRGNKIQKEG